MTDVVLSSRPILERFTLAGRAALVTGAGASAARSPMRWARPALP